MRAHPPQPRPTEHQDAAHQDAPHLDTPHLDTGDEVRALVDASTGDPLSPFLLQPGREYVFSDDRRAVLGGRTRWGTLVVGGDPVGDPGSWDSAASNLLRHARDAGLRVAVLGAGEQGRRLWQRHGLSALAIGRDVVLHSDHFDLVGRRFRNLRQAIQRTRNAGITTETLLEVEVSGAVLHELTGLYRAAGRDDERGFSMILGHPFDGRQPQSLVVIARDRAGGIVAAHRYLRAGVHDLSLDVPVRAPKPPNGADERLIAEAVAWGREHGIERISLAFAPFPDLFDPDADALHRALARGVHVLDPLIRLESLYRYLRKFHAFDQERSVMLRWHQVVPVALAMLTLEFSAQGSSTH